MIKTHKEKTLESRIAKLERKLHSKNESTGPAAVALYEAVGEGRLRWKDLADAFMDIADEQMCLDVCEYLGVDL